MCFNQILCTKHIFQKQKKDFKFILGNTNRLDFSVTINTGLILTKDIVLFLQLYTDHKLLYSKVRLSGAYGTCKCCIYPFFSLQEIENMEAICNCDTSSNLL